MLDKIIIMNMNSVLVFPANVAIKTHDRMYYLVPLRVNRHKVCIQP